MSDHILLSYALDGPRRGQALVYDDVAQDLAADTLTWVHLDLDHPDTPDWLRQNLSYLDRHAIDALLADETRPRATEIGDGLLVFLHGVNLNEGTEPEDMVSLRLWIDDRRIISLLGHPLRAIDDIKSRIRAGTGPGSAGQFIALLLDRLTAQVEPILSEIDDATDELEEQLVDHASPALRRPITAIRRRAIHLRRYLAPQRDAASMIRTSNLRWIDDLNRRRIAEAQDKLTRTIEDLDAIRERSQIVKDELTNALADRLNRNTYVLSVIAAIFLPLGFLTGLLGINVGGIPGAENPVAFAIVCVLLVGVVVLQIVVFRLLRWF